ncbi:MAG: MarR family winged helix-turn-helix transcriptional regulator [Iodobacter sp.]
MSTIKSPAEADDVFEMLHAIMHLFRASLHSKPHDMPDELTYMEGKTLGFFARHPGATLSDLVSHSGKDKAQLTRQIKGLKERGLLEAEPSTEDRRSVRLHTTEAALALHARARAQDKIIAARALAGISPEESAQLIGLLQHIRTNLEEKEASLK